MIEFITIILETLFLAILFLAIISAVDILQRAYFHLYPIHTLLQAALF